MDLLAQYSDASGEGGAGDGDTDDDVATDDDRESLEPSRFARVERRRSETSAVHLVEKNYAERGSFLRVERSIRRATSVDEEVYFDECFELRRRRGD